MRANPHDPGGGGCDRTTTRSQLGFYVPPSKDFTPVRHCLGPHGSISYLPLSAVSAIVLAAASIKGSFAWEKLPRHCYNMASVAVGGGPASLRMGPKISTGFPVQCNGKVKHR